MASYMYISDNFAVLGEDINNIYREKSLVRGEEREDKGFWIWQ